MNDKVNFDKLHGEYNKDIHVTRNNAWNKNDVYIIKGIEPIRGLSIMLEWEIY